MADTTHEIMADRREKFTGVRSKAKSLSVGDLRATNRSMLPHALTCDNCTLPVSMFATKHRLTLFSQTSKCPPCPSSTRRRSSSSSAAA